MILKKREKLNIVKEELIDFPDYRENNDRLSKNQPIIHNLYDILKVLGILFF
jgi:hypothetical protein